MFVGDDIYFSNDCLILLETGLQRRAD